MTFWKIDGTQITITIFIDLEINLEFIFKLVWVKLYYVLKELINQWKLSWDIDFLVINELEFTTTIG